MGRHSARKWLPVRKSIPRGSSVRQEAQTSYRGSLKPVSQMNRMPVFEGHAQNVAGLRISRDMPIDAQIHVLLQALCAAVLGGILGWEREAAGKWAGLRTHMLVCISVVFFVQLGQHLTAGSTPGDTSQTARGDPVRIIEALATCIAFLGAGTIIRDRDTETARGLTTAASLLITASIGVAVALDCYLIAAGATAIALFILRTLGWIEGRFETQKSK